MDERLAARDLEHRAALIEMTKYFAAKVGSIFRHEVTLHGQLAAT
jgi:hypothetical protein